MFCCIRGRVKKLDCGGGVGGGVSIGPLVMHIENKSHRFKD